MLAESGEAVLEFDGEAAVDLQDFAEGLCGGLHVWEIGGVLNGGAIKIVDGGFDARGGEIDELSRDEASVGEELPKGLSIHVPFAVGEDAVLGIELLFLIELFGFDETSEGADGAFSGGAGLFSGFEAATGLLEFRIDFEGFFELDDGLLDVLHIQIDIAEVLVGFCHLGIEANGFAVGGDGESLLIEPTVREAEVVVSDGGGAFDLDTLAEDFDGALMISESVEDGTPVDEGCSGTGAESGDLLELFGGFFEFSGVEAGHAEGFKAFGVEGVFRTKFFEESESLIDLSALHERADLLLQLVEFGVGLVWHCDAPGEALGAEEWRDDRRRT